MGMRPDWYLEAFVEPNLLDCREAPGDVRRAFNAAVSASSFVDHYFKYQERHNPEAVASFKSVGELVGHISDETDGASRDIRSISNVYKHLYNVDSPSYRYETVSSCGSIEVLKIEETGPLAEISEDFSVSEGGASRAAVVFTRRDGSRGEVIPALETVVSYFRDLLYRNA